MVATPSNPRTVRARAVVAGRANRTRYHQSSASKRRTGPSRLHVPLARKAAAAVPAEPIDCQSRRAVDEESSAASGGADAISHPEPSTVRRLLGLLRIR